MRFGCLIIFSLISTTGKGNAINLGVLSYDVFIPSGPGAPGIDAFNIANFTGLFDLPPTFPVTDSLTLQGAILTLFQTGQAPQVFPLGDIVSGFLLDAFGNPVVQVPDGELFSSAELTATLNVAQFALVGGGAFAVSSTAIDTVLLPSSGSALIPSVDFALIQASGTASTPEPASVALLLAMLPACVWLLRTHLIKRQPSSH